MMRDQLWDHLLAFAGFYRSRGTRRETDVPCDEEQAHLNPAKQQSHQRRHRRTRRRKTGNDPGQRIGFRERDPKLHSRVFTGINRKKEHEGSPVMKRDFPRTVSGIVPVLYDTGNRTAVSKENAISRRRRAFCTWHSGGR